MHRIILIVALALLAPAFTQQAAAQRYVLVSGDTLAANTIVWGSTFVPVKDSVKTHKITVYTVGGGSPVAVTNNFRVVYRAQKQGILSDTSAVASVAAAANLSSVLATKTGVELMTLWIPALSGTDSTAIWEMRRETDYTVQYGLIPYASHKGGQKVVLSVTAQ